jgi:uncharacterized protein YneF (UPF0154 family)
VALSGGLLGGVLGAIVALIAALIIGFVVSRRIQMRKQKALLADYQQQLQMVREGQGGGGRRGDVGGRIWNRTAC